MTATKRPRREPLIAWAAFIGLSIGAVVLVVVDPETSLRAWPAQAPIEWVEIDEELQRLTTFRFLSPPGGSAGLWRDAPWPYIRTCEQACMTWVGTAPVVPIPPATPLPPREM